MARFTFFVGSLLAVAPASADWVIFTDGQRTQVQAIEIAERAVHITTQAGKRWSVLRDSVDVAATLAANETQAPPMTPNFKTVSFLTVAPRASSFALSVDDDDSLSIDERDTLTDGPPEAPEVMSRDGEGRVTLRAVRLDSELTLDGRLEENFYRTVPAIDGFIQQEPHEGQPATEKTEVWVFFDNDNVYISARNWDTEPDRIVANEMRRDSRNIFNNDNFAVILDTFYDRRDGFMFMTNPLGALYDAQVTGERNVNADWNTVWNVKTARLAEGWTVEMSIPFKSLRYKQGQSQIWGINFRRIVRSKQEFSYLTPIPQAFRQRGLIKLSFAGTLVGVEPPTSSLNLEVKPYATAAVRTDRDADVPFENDLDPDVGFDAKYGVTKSLVADFTVNTDFAQVEADDQQVNLTRFGLFFPEKREFFLEGQGIFAFGGSTGRRFGGGSDTPIMFFSRRIGLDAGFGVPIQAGARLTGRQGRYTIGLLNMQTRGIDTAAIEPTNFSVVRIKRDIFRRSSIGVIATHRDNSFDYDGSNSLLGVDAAFTFYENLNINAYYSKSQTEGLDGKDDSYRARVSYGSDRYGFSFSHLTIGEDFNPDIGFMRRSDVRKTSGRLSFSPRPKSIASVRRFRFQTQFEYFENNLGQVETKQFELEFSTEFDRGDNLNINYTRNFEFLFDDFEISDGIIVPVGGYEFSDVRVFYRLGPQRRFTGFVIASTGGFFGGTRSRVSYRGRVELTPEFSIEPDISQNWVDLPVGAFTTTLLRLRSTYTLSSRSFAAALIQYNTSNSSLSMNLRYRWEYQPGSDIFVVYTDGRDTQGLGYPDLRNQSFVVKFTRLFRF